jgi:hypothetical protein
MRKGGGGIRIWYGEKRRLEAVHVHLGCLEEAKMYNVQDVNVKES